MGRVRTWGQKTHLLEARHSAKHCFRKVPLNDGMRLLRIVLVLVVVLVVVAGHAFDNDRDRGDSWLSEECPHLGQELDLLIFKLLLNGQYFNPGLQLVARQLAGGNLCCRTVRHCIPRDPVWLRGSEQGGAMKKKTLPKRVEDLILVQV